MASLLDIRKQIGGVKNTQKITKAMKLVAASKSRQFQKKAISIRNFAFELLAILQKNSSAFQKHQFLESRTEGKVLFIVYSSDKGLCGALNQRMFRTLLRSSEWLNTSEEDRMIMAIGKKAVSFLRYNGMNPELVYESVNEKISTLDALSLIEPILSQWESKKIRQVYMVAPHYKNAFTFYPIVKQFLPLGGDILRSHIGVDPVSFEKVIKESADGDMIFEPNKQILAEKMFEMLSHTLFLQAFYELKASEYSSRMMAMQNATDAATKLIHEKTLQLNKARQAAITKEISEIVGASFV